MGKLYLERLNFAIYFWTKSNISGELFGTARLAAHPWLLYI